MEQRGIGAQVIVVVIVIVAIAGAGSYFVSQGATQRSSGETGSDTMPPGSGSIPVYAGASESVEQENLLEQLFENLGLTGLELKAYTSSDSPQFIAAWYQDAMSQAGWTKENESSYVGSSVTSYGFLYRQAADGAIINVSRTPTDEKTQLIIVTGSWDKVEAALSTPTTPAPQGGTPTGGTEDQGDVDIRLNAELGNVGIKVYAWLVNENIARFHIQRIGGETIYFDDSPSTEKVRGWATDPITGIENELYAWTFEDPTMFNVGDWTQAEAQLCGANLEIGKTVAVSVYVSFDGEDWIENFYLVTIGSLDDMPPLT